MTQEFRSPGEGISIYSPETGWQERPFPPEGAEVSLADSASPPRGQDLAAAMSTAENLPSGLGVVGDSLERLFLMLEQRNENGLQQGWQEIVGLCREIDEHSIQKEEMLRSLAMLESKIAASQSKLTSALDLLSQSQRKEVEAAKVRAELSAAVSSVIQKKFSEKA